MEEHGKGIARTDGIFQITVSRSLEMKGKERLLWQEGASRLGKTLVFLFEGERNWCMLGAFAEGADGRCW